MKKAIIMSRVSSDEQAKGYSLDIQEEKLVKFCNEKNIEVVKVVREDHSAKNFNRPEWKTIKSYVKNNKGKIDYLLITSWDRFSRNSLEGLIEFHALRNSNVEVQAIENWLDFSIPENYLLLNVYLGVPEVDNRRRSIKIQEGVRKALKSGRWSRKAPRGYQNTRDEFNKPLIIPCKDATFIKMAFNQALKGVNQADIRSNLLDKGFVISKNGLSTLLRNPVYMGMIVVPELLDEDEHLVEGLHEGIIDTKVFYAVQDILNEKRRSLKKASSTSQFREELPLRGILRCSKCQEKVTGSPSRSKTGNRYFYYHCNKCRQERYRADKIDTLFYNFFKSCTFKNEVKDLYKLMVKDLLGGDEQKRKHEVLKLNKEITDVESQLERLEDNYLNQEIDLEMFKKMRQRKEGQRLKLETKKKEISAVKSNFEKWLGSGVNFLSNIHNTYINSDLPTKQQIISSIFPEYLDFDGIKCRTPRLNEVILRMLLIDKGLGEKEGGKISQKLLLPPLVELRGIEPRSS